MEEVQERQIRTARKALRAVTGTQVLDDERLHSQFDEEVSDGAMKGILSAIASRTGLSGTECASTFGDNLLNFVRLHAAGCQPPSSQDQQQMV